MKLTNEELYKTLEAFADNDMNIKQTANSIFLYRNTLIYRLDKIKKVTGLDPHNFHDLAKLLGYTRRDENGQENQEAI